MCFFLSSSRITVKFLIFALQLCGTVDTALKYNPTHKEVGVI